MGNRLGTLLERTVQAASTLALPPTVPLVLLPTPEELTLFDTPIPTAYTTCHALHARYEHATARLTRAITRQNAAARRYNGIPDRRRDGEGVRAAWGRYVRRERATVQAVREVERCAGEVVRARRECEWLEWMEEERVRGERVVRWMEGWVEEGGGGEIEREERRGRRRAGRGDGGRRK